MPSTLSKKYFLSVDELVVFKWSKCLNGNLTYMRRDLSKGSEAQDHQAWREFREDHIQRIGMSDEQLKFNQLKDAHTAATFAFISEPFDSPRKPLLQNDMEYAKDELDYFLKTYDQKTDSNQIDKRFAQLYKDGVRVTQREMTVLEFHYITKPDKKS